MKRVLELGLQRAFPMALLVRHALRRIARPVRLGVRALVVEHEHILLVRTHGSQKWSMPGGGVKRGESLRAAAEREACEETGCVVEAQRLLGIYTKGHEGMTNHVAVFICRSLSPLTRGFNIEIAEARYWPIDSLPETTSGSLQRRLDEFTAGSYGLDGPW